MTAAYTAALGMLIADGFSREQSVAWLADPGHRGTIVFVGRLQRADALQRSGLVETPTSERAGELVRAVLSVASEGEQTT